MLLSYKRMEYNSNISYMGKLRQYLYCPDMMVTAQKSSALDGMKRWSPDGSVPNPVQAHINGKQLITMETRPLRGLDAEDEVNIIKMESRMRNLRHQLKKQAAESEILPYSFTRALNLGQPPPRHQQGELIQFTDPWKTEASKVLTQM